MERVVLAVDIGTSSLKAALIDPRGTVLANARCRFPRARRAPADWVAAFDEALAILKATSGDRKGTRPPEIAAITISGNGPTVVSVGPGGEPGEILLWNDPVPPADKIRNPARPSRSLFIPRIEAFRTLFPAQYESARWILSGPEFLVWHLTGNPVTILPEQRFAIAYWTADSIEAAGLDGSKLAPFVAPGAGVGMTGKRGQVGTGVNGRATAGSIPEGIPVIAGGPDFIVALIGTDTLAAGKACDRAGTSEGLNVCTETPVADPLVRPLPSVVPGLWNAAYLLPETGADFNVWRRESGQATRSYPDLMAEIEASPIFPASGTPTHPGREVVERIGFSVRKGIETLSAATGMRPVYGLSGGQARNDTWSRMKADITGATFALTSTPDGELMGDAILGFAGTGEYSGIADAARAMVRTVRVYEPDAGRHALYTEKYLAASQAGI